MATPSNKPLGVTPPLSTALPTESEVLASNTLVEELKRQDNYESAADTQKRTAVLHSLQSIADEFVKRALKDQDYSENLASTAGSRIFTFGSFRLGVFGPGSDIDTLVVAPKKVSRDDFFKYFPDLLIEMTPEGAITDLKPVEESFVPIIKFEYSGISIDLIFCSLQTQEQILPTLDLLDNKNLIGLNEVDLRCVNGTRVTDAILELVPQKAVFRTALRAIKLWAQRRAIYANIIGFPGGVAWAMLVARVCQLYPKATSSTVVLKFFMILKNWQWPMPVLLRPVEHNNKLPVKVWNPKQYPSDFAHLMPIITPAYPSMCATHNITHSTKEIIIRELRRGSAIADRVMMNKAPWKELFGKHSFFTEGYRYYLSIIAASTTREAQNTWAGLVESKVRLLVAAVENHESIYLAHPFNKGFDRVHECKNDEEIEKAKSGSLQFQIKEIPTATIDASVNIKEEGVTVEAKGKNVIVYTTTYYVGLELKEGAKSLDLSWEVDSFKLRCTRWDKYDKEASALNVIHTRNFDLPDDVFTTGEVKPARLMKKRKKAGADDAPSVQPNKKQQTSIAAVG